MLSTHIEQLWDQNPEFRQKIIQFLSSLDVSDDFYAGEENKIEQHQNQPPSFELILKLGLLLVHPNPNIRNQAVNFYNQNFPSFGLQLFDPGNIIDEMPLTIKSIIVQKMIQNYKNADSNYLNFATFWLGMYGTEDCLPFLIKNLSHPSIGIVEQVIRTLGIYGSPRAIPYLLPLIHRFNDSPEIKKAVIEAVGILGEEGIGIQSLIHELYSKDNTDYDILEDYLKSFGARILKYISCEIEFEKETERKKKLQIFCNKISHIYAIKNSQQYNILL